MRQYHASASPPPSPSSGPGRIAMVRDAELARDVLARSRKSPREEDQKKKRDDEDELAHKGRRRQRRPPLVSAGKGATLFRAPTPVM